MHHDKRERWRNRRVEMEAGRGRSTPAGRKGDPPWARALPWVEGALGGWLAGGRRNALDIRRVDVELDVGDLPHGLDGFSILHVSDPHPSALDGLVEQARDLVAGLEADLAVVTGDFQIHGRPSASVTAAALAPLFAAMRTRHGTFAVLGNHDSHEMVPALESIGVRVLVDEHWVLHHDHGARVVLTGTDDVHRFYTEASLRALRTAPEGFRIALVHSPDLAQQAASAGQRLYLTGHTHGGQICLPGGAPVITATAAPRRMAAGCWQCGAMTGYTSRGMGVGRPPLRYNSRGEITRIVLRRRVG